MTLKFSKILVSIFKYLNMAVGGRRRECSRNLNKIASLPLGVTDRHCSIHKGERVRTFSHTDYKLTTPMNVWNIPAYGWVSAYFNSRVSMCKPSLTHNAKSAFAVQCYTDLSVFIIPAEKCYQSTKKANMFKAKRLIKKVGTRYLKLVPWLPQQTIPDHCLYFPYSSKNSSAVYNLLHILREGHHILIPNPQFINLLSNFLPYIIQTTH